MVLVCPIFLVYSLSFVSFSVCTHWMAMPHSSQRGDGIHVCHGLFLFFSVCVPSTFLGSDVGSECRNAIFLTSCWCCCWFGHHKFKATKGLRCVLIADTDIQVCGNDWTVIGCRWQVVVENACRQHAEAVWRLKRFQA